MTKMLKLSKISFFLGVIAVIAFPLLYLDISIFWQKEHFKLHPEKKIVPEPLSPLIGGSS